MTEKLNEETIWYLKKIMELGEQAISEGKTYTQEEVKSFIKARFHDHNVASTCVG